jgi:ABC-type nickel/cobalt efflux system permease component RcnA
MSGYRYSRPKVRTALVVAAGLTAVVSGTAWMLMLAFHVRHADLYASASAAVFFAFVSATMLWRYLRNEVVLAVQPTGLYDSRWRSDAVAWEAVREVVVRRKEDEVELDVYLWQPQMSGGRREVRPDHTIELAPLEGSAASIVGAIAEHVTVRQDAGALGADAGSLLRARG